MINLLLGLHGLGQFLQACYFVVTKSSQLVFTLILGILSFVDSQSIKNFWVYIFEYLRKVLYLVQ